MVDETRREYWRRRWIGELMAVASAGMIAEGGRGRSWEQLVDETREVASMMVRVEFGEEAPSAVLGLSDHIHWSDFSIRAEKCLSSYFCERNEPALWSSIARLSERDLLLIKNFGKTSLREIKEMLAKRGLKLRGE